jgi:anti-sigma B factor antagonist
VNAKSLDTNRVWKYGWRVQITSEVRDNVDFIKISGRMIHDGSLIRLREHVLYELQSGIRRFVIDISEVPHIDSSGCGEVISAHTSILRANGALAFVNPSERVRLLWEWTRIREVLQIFDTLDEARQFVCE